jgi:hypothetical protein
MAFPVVLPMLATVLVALTGSIVGRALVALGLTVVYYRGITVALDWAYAQFIANFNALPAVVLQLAGVLQVGTCVAILFTAMGIRATLLGLSSDGFKRWVLQ